MELEFDDLERGKKYFFCLKMEKSRKGSASIYFYLEEDMQGLFQSGFLVGKDLCSGFITVGNVCVTLVIFEVDGTYFSTEITEFISQFRQYFSESELVGKAIFMTRQVGNWDMTCDDICTIIDVSGFHFIM